MIRRFETWVTIGENFGGSRRVAGPGGEARRECVRRQGSVICSDWAGRVGWWDVSGMVPGAPYRRAWGREPAAAERENGRRPQRSAGRRRWTARAASAALLNQYR